MLKEEELDRKKAFFSRKLLHSIVRPKDAKREDRKLIIWKESFCGEQWRVPLLFLTQPMSFEMTPHLVFLLPLGNLQRQPLWGACH